MQNVGVRLDDLKDAARRDPLAAYAAAGYLGELTTSNDNLLGLCPFHAEKTPSFTIFPDGGFRCFGCGAQGSIIDFHLHLNYSVENPGPEALRTPGAVDDLAQRLHVEATPAPEKDWTLHDYAAHVLLPLQILRARDCLFNISPGVRD